MEKLLATRFIREVQYPEWLENVVVVPKKNDKWNICVDYLNLNEACLKDSFPLLRIDQIVDATARDELISFMDAYSGYNQIPMFSPDIMKIVFITIEDVFYYKVMSFGLKNAGAMYQIMMTKIFQPLFGKTMEAYIDYMLVMLPRKDYHTSHLQKAFILIREHHLKLNLAKCAFSVSSEKFLGNLVTKRGIEVCPTRALVLV